MLIGSQYTQVIQKLVVLLVPGLTSKSTVLSLPLLPTSATKNPSLPILPIPLPSDPPRPTASNPPPPPSSVDPHSEEATTLYGGVPFITRAFSPCLSYSRARRCNTHPFRPQHTPFSRHPSVARRKRDGYRSAFLVRVFAFVLTPIVYLYRSGTVA